MQQKLPSLGILVIVLLVVASTHFSFVHAAQDQVSDTQTSDFVLDIQNGEKDTVNDVDAQNNQKDVADSEQTEAALDDGDPSTGVVQASLDEAVQPEEAQESAKLVENPQASSSENDNGEVLKDQAGATVDEKAEVVAPQVNEGDQNKAPVIDPDTSQSSQGAASLDTQQPTPAPVEQPLDQIQSLPDATQTDNGDQLQPTEKPPTGENQ